MINGKRITAVILGVLTVTAAGYADMVSTSGMGVGLAAGVSVESLSAPPFTHQSALFGSLIATDLDRWSIGFLPEANANAAETAAMQDTRVRPTGPDSLALCLSALMGLGLYRSIHRAKRLSFGFIPEWYHDGKPFQVGHSHAVMPSSLCSVLSHCFIQPDCTPKNIFAQYRLGAIMSLWRISQFVRAVAASRGPPLS